MLGALDNNSSAQYVPMQKSDTEMYALYVQDDFRIHDKVTLNLGLRWEYEGGLFDPEYRLPREVDLTQPIPGLQAAIDPRIPADVKAIMAESAGQKTLYLQRRVLLHRRRASPKRRTSRCFSSCRASASRGASIGKRPCARATARFYTPQMLVNENATMGQLDLGAFSPVTPILPDLQGVPQVDVVQSVPAGTDAGLLANGMAPTPGWATT